MSWLEDNVLDPIGDAFSDVGSFLWAGIETGLNWVTGGLYDVAKNYLGDFIEGLTPEQEFRDRERTVRGGAEERQIIYGRVRTGGQLIYVEDTGKDNTILWLCYVIAGHECEEIEAVYANGEKIAESNGPGVNGAMTRVSSNVAGDNAVCWSVHGNRFSAFIPSQDVNYQDNSYDVTNSTPPNWTTDHRLSYQTYVWVSLVFDNEQFGDTGLPKFTFDVKGKNDIYDPRTGTTGYTTNQALCLLDVLLWDRMFDADLSEIDQTAFIAAANLAGQQVPASGGQFEPRYTVNGTAKFNIRPIDLLESMERAGAGFAFWLQGEWTYVPGDYQAPVMSLDESDLVGGFEFSSGPGKKAKHNVASGTYVDADQDFEVVGFPELYVSSYVSNDGEVLEKEYDFPFTNSGTMARRLAKIDIERTRFGISASAVFKFKALRLTPGDRISLTISELGWTPKVFRVTSSKLSWGKGVELALREDAPEVYEWTEGDALALPAPPVLSIPGGLSISAPTNLEFSESLYDTIDRQKRAQLTVTWPDQPSAEAYDVQFKPASSSTWIEAGAYWRDNQIVIRDLVDSTYDVRVRTIGTFGKRSLWYEESYTITGTVPEAVDALSLQELANEPKHPDAVFSTVVVDTVPPADANYSHSVVEYQVVGEPDWFRVGPTDDNGSARFTALSDGRTYNVRAFAVSTVGVRAGVAVTASITVSNAIDIDDPDVGSYLPAPNVNGLELTGQGNDAEFTGGDAKFEWRKTTVEQWYQIGEEGQLGASAGRLDQYFRDYQVEVWADVDGVERLIRTEFVVDPIYVYTFEKNAEDYRRKVGEVGAWRSFEVRVYCRGRLNQLSVKPARLQVSNPAPDPLQNVQVVAGFSVISISYNRPDDLDFAGVQIWISSTQGFNPDTTEPTVTISDNSYVAEGLEQGETYYVRFRPFDEFGTEGADVSAEIAVTTKTGTDLSGLSGWAYEVDPVDREFVEANMADGAIDLAAALVAGALPGSKLSDLAVTAGKLADGSVELDGSKVAGALPSGKLADLAVTAAKLADGSVALDGNKITGQLGQVNLADSAVTTSKLAELSITAAKLASSSVTATKIANLAVGTAAIANAAITNAKIANLAVDTAQIQNAAIVEAKIANLAVGTAAIQDAAIEEAKIANLAVGTAAIQDLAVSDAKIQAVTAGKILTGTLAATETITSEGLIRAVDSISSPTVQAGLGPTELTLDGVPFTALFWAFNSSGVTFAVDELGNPYFKGEIEASGFTNNELTIDAQGNLTSTGTFRFGGASNDFIEFDGTDLLVETPFLSVDPSTVLIGDEPSGQFLRYAGGVLDLGENTSIGSNVDRTVTVGPTGDFATINEALETLSRTVPAYKPGGFNATILLESSYVEVEGIEIYGIDLSWIKIRKIPSAGPLEYDCSAAGSRSYVVEARQGARAPLLDFDLRIIAPSGGSMNGILYAGENSYIEVEKRNLSTQSRITYDCNFNVGALALRADVSSTIVADLMRIENHNGTYGVGANNFSKINYFNGELSMSNAGGVLADYGGSVECTLLNCSSTIQCLGASRGGQINCISGTLSSSLSVEGNIFDGGIINMNNTAGSTNVTRNTLTADGIIYG